MTLPADSRDPQSPSQPGHPAAPESAAGDSRGRLVLIAALLLAVVWYVFLGLTTAVTSNPVTFNRAQLRAAEYIVRGELTNGKLTVEHVWKGELSETHIDVAPPDAGKPWPYPPGRYIVPLTQSNGRFEITTPPTRAAVKPLAYPQTDDTVAALETILAEFEAANGTR